MSLNGERVGVEGASRGPLGFGPDSLLKQMGFTRLHFILKGKIKLLKNHALPIKEAGLFIG